jgi:hypothetical protein
MLEVVSGLDLHSTATGVWSVGEHSVSSAKGFLVGAGSAGAAALLAVKKHSSGQEGTVKNGRVRRVDQGWIGLRERNNHFYKSIQVGENEWEKEFFKLMVPGLRIAPHPLRKYKLINTQNQPLDLERFRVQDKAGRQHDINADIIWGHIRGIDEHGQRIRYEHRGQEVSVEQLVLNGIMAAKDEHGVAKQVGSRVGDVLRQTLQDREDVREVATKVLFGELVELCKDDLLDIGVELRALAIPQKEHTVLDHYKNGAGTSPTTGSLDLPAIEQVLPGAAPSLHIVYPDEA